jgi:hypothetical protein
MTYPFYADDTYAKSSTADEPKAIHLLDEIVVGRDSEENKKTTKYIHGSSYFRKIIKHEIIKFI